MCRRVAILVVIFLALPLTVTRAQDTWVAKEGAVKNSELKDAIFSRDGIYVATKSALYKAKDIKERWEPIFLLPSGGSNEITCIAGRPRGMFVGTRRGLFRSDDFGQTWKNVFRTILPDKNNITYIELSKHNRTRVLISTEKGIFLSDDLGVKWQDISACLKNGSVRCLALNKEYMYAGGESGLYIRKTDCGDWERVFVRSVKEKTESEEPQEYSGDDNEKDMSIRTIAIDGARVYIGYSKNILYSDDQGKSWKNLTNGGLKGEISNILISAKNKKIYCATYNGVFEFNEQKSYWLELYKGMTKSVNISRLIFGSDDENIIYAVTDKGLFSFQGGDYLMDKYPDIEKSLNTLKVAFDGEPTYKELQQAAIRYCDVSAEKIRNWQRDSKMKAIVPKLSLGMANHRSSNTQIYTSATKDYVTVGPDDTYNAFDASVSWDLGNLIWGDDQTNIDVRSRLMVQLGHSTISLLHI
jgi:photosystem II stability/assembly factor-like uncharacterized protein